VRLPRRSPRANVTRGGLAPTERHDGNVGRILRHLMNGRGVRPLLMVPDILEVTNPGSLKERGQSVSTSSLFHELKAHAQQ